MFPASGLQAFEEYCGVSYKTKSISLRARNGKPTHLRVPKDQDKPRPLQISIRSGGVDAGMFVGKSADEVLGLVSDKLLGLGVDVDTIVGKKSAGHIKSENPHRDTPEAIRDNAGSVVPPLAAVSQGVDSTLSSSIKENGPTLADPGHNYAPNGSSSADNRDSRSRSKLALDALTVMMTSGFLDRK